MKRILVVDDDTVYRERLARALARQGHAVATAWDVASTRKQAEQLKPDAAVLDLRLPTCSGLDLLKLLRGGNPEMRVLILTGYGSIANALEAVRLGAWDYLNKPADAEQILAALTRDKTGGGTESHDFAPPSLARIEWEHIQRVLADHDGNVSHAADALGIHRRTLQRKLQKLPPEL